MRPIALFIYIAAIVVIFLAIPSVEGNETKTLDHGLLDPAWFGPGVEFLTASGFDYIWVKRGFEVEGKSIRVEKWPDPVFLGKERRGRDAAQAFEFVDSIPLRIRSALRETLRETATIVTEGGDLILAGRLVDYVAKGTHGKSTPQATWDLKITDAATGELLVAIHHRKLQSLSSTNERVDSWLAEFAVALKENFAAARKGQPAKD